MSVQESAELTAIAGGVTVRVRGAALVAAAQAVLDRAAAEQLASRLAGGDPEIWGEAARAEAAVRLGWLGLPTSSRQLLPRLAELAGQVRAAGLDHVVLAGMGGSSLAPEVITLTAGVELTVLDTTDPGQVRRALGDRLARTVVVVGSKSGSTVETDSHYRVYRQALTEAGLDPAERIVVVTDPGSPLAERATAAGHRVVLADPNVGGRYSALSAFGLVPSALAGVDVAELLDAAAGVSASLAVAEPTANPGLLLGAVLGGAALTGQDKAVIADHGSSVVGFGDWAEQLVAESTGKENRGILPVVVEGAASPGFADAGADAVLVTLGGGLDADGIEVSGPLGAQFLVWEYATAVAGFALGTNPFDQPNVQESKDNTNALLASGVRAVDQPVLTDGPVQVFGDAALLADVKDVAGAVHALLDTVPGRGYLAVLAYLDRFADAAAAELRPLLAQRLAGRQATFGWGPRFLHSTGQYHKGGPQLGVFLQLTGENSQDLPVPERPYTFGQLQLAQALGDVNALRGRGRPVLRLHLTDRAAGLAYLRELLD